TVASCGAMVGIMIGSVAVGILYDIVPSIAVLYGIMIVILAVCLFLMPVVHEPLDQTLSLRAVMRVRVYIPTDNRRLVAVVAVCYLATWLVSCFYQSFSAPIAQQCSARPRLWLGRSFWPHQPSSATRNAALRTPAHCHLRSVTVTTALISCSSSWARACCGRLRLFNFAMGVAVSVSLRSASARGRASRRLPR
ncbi:MAG: hypothetical protein ACLUW6_10675, partial [Coriobacteriaceae bacterium]